MYSVQTSGVFHHFSENDPVLKDIALQVPSGSIYGFLGPNGAGKTTTLRLLLGLIKKQQGSILIFDKPIENHRMEILRNIGSLIEMPSMYGHLTASENLRIWQQLYQCPYSRIAKALETVDLANTGTKKVSQFSLGMKQRLGIAAALLHEPSLLILDEPTNGLDPYGMMEIRDLLKKLNYEHGITIVISSHLLSEIEKLVTHTGIISHGQMVFQGTLDSLVSRQLSASKLILNTSNNLQATDVLKLLQLDTSIENGMLTIPIPEKEMIAQLNRELVKANIDVYEINPVQKDLETIFMELINQTTHA
ncbi:ABC transporter ATP-binding protein [Ferruginibacter sp. HRS2-29]|uniref:ABC transporter ATP-binding protein n=1 Tax=Ferruginibacter sp. HRS2-29 TaxID=2487334 RepID=UPI0020CC326B|nr:ABC transporter ATP-binding protein [Ferruginibacter sp. HRS2-29]MCP9750714.1 ABC transporter ATP-binding protein [Ferruginibacter sp. HRS2-29]